MRAPSYSWGPIEPPKDAKLLEIQELRAFTKLWNQQRARLLKHGVLKQFQERMARWWSIETGVIERIYDVSAGATRVLIEQGFVASLIAHGDTNVDPQHVVQILGDHRDALEMVMDLVGGARKLSTSWIKELHALITRNQKTTHAKTPTGQLVEIPLLRGAWKQQPNNPETSDGSIHEYCPPEHVAAEMDQLIALYESLSGAAPEVRSAWLHHAFTQIHPFQDGNGRVARALASIDFIRAGLFPLLVAREDRDRLYIPALEQADAGDLRPLTEFFAHCVQRVLTHAISEAETAVETTATLDAVLDVARSKIQSRAESAEADRNMMAVRIQNLAQLAEAELGRTGAEAQKKVPGITYRTELWAEKTAHYFRAQLIELARRHDYWADLREPRTWARLQLKDGGVTDIIVALHFIGNPSPGACVAMMFLQHRDLAEPKPVADSLVTLGVDPLLLAHVEGEDEQRTRFEKWLREAQLQALAQWTRYL